MPSKLAKVSELTTETNRALAAEEFSLNAPVDFQVINRGALAGALNRSSSERVAVVRLGDSNEGFSGGGWSTYFAKYLMQAYGCFGTGLTPMGNQYASQNPVYGFSAGRNNDGANTGAPTSLNNLMPSGAIFPTEYDYVADGSSVNIQSFQHGAIVTVNHPLDIRGALRFRFSYGSFVTGTTTFQPTCRIEGGAYSTIASDSVRNPVTGSHGAVDSFFDISADPTRNVYGIAWTPKTVGSTLSGPFLGYNISIENKDKSTGISYGCLMYAAGSSARSYLQQLNTFGDTALTEYFRQLRLQLTGTNKSTVIFISGGINDRNETSASLGPNPTTPGDSAAAFVDNITGIITKLQSNWILAGGTATTIHFCVIVSHPFSNPEDTELVSYRNAISVYVRGVNNASSIIIPNIRSYDDFAAGSWYDSGGNAHLSTTGYDRASSAIVRAIKMQSDSQPLIASATLDFPSIAAAASADLNVFCVGAAVGDTVSLGLPASPTAGIVFNAFVSVADIVTVRAFNITAGAIDPASATYRVTVIKA